jgi:hypothetical protein
VWQGLLADGVIDVTKMRKKYAKQTGLKTKDDYHTAITDMLYDIHKRGRIKVFSDTEDVISSNSQCQKATCDSVYQMPICETYVLSVNMRKYSSILSSKSYVSSILEELKDAEPNRFAILILSNCKDLEECSKKALVEFGFVPQPKEAYQRYRKFSKAAHKLIEESIEYFEAPCCKLFKHLKQQGFAGDHVTYP